MLALLVKAFRRKLIFTVGFSPTRNQDNVICWNGIHHKPNTAGGTSNYGYPDPTYFNRVKNELADKGVLLDGDGSVEVKEATGGILTQIQMNQHTEQAEIAKTRPNV